MQRIEFITQDDSLYILPFFSEFLRQYGQEFSIVRISCCPPMGSRPRRKLLQELGWLYGPIGLCRLSGRVLGSKLLGMLPAGPGRKRYWSIGQLCRAYGVRFDRIGNPNDADFVAGLRDRAPDLLVSIACPYILKDAVLNTPPLGCLNIHHAPLPRYKGMMPTFWQMLHGESSVGLTVHYMAKKVDEGRILLQDALKINPGEPLDSLIRRSKAHAAHCLAKVLREIGAGHAHQLEMPQEESSYFTFPNRDQIREFHRKGLRAI